MTAAGWTNEERAAVCEWLRLHDVDPGRVPESATFEYDVEAHRWTTQIFAVEPAFGGPVVGTVEVSFTERAPWPLDRRAAA